MTNYIYGTVITNEAVAANNRGDNIGNTTTLQKVFVNDAVHTSVSAESIRFALRYRLQLERIPVNRTYDPETGKLAYEDEKRISWSTGEVFADDDLMGFMDAAAAKAESEAEAETEDEGETAKSKGKKAKAKGTTVKHQSPVAIGRAVSLRPYRGEVSFNCVSGEKAVGKLSLYNAEMHTTEYQYSFGLNLDDVKDKKNIAHLLRAIVDPPQVAGNHSRFAYDFSPASIVLRVTNEHSSRIQNCFAHDEMSRAITIERLIRKIESNDIPAKEILVGGEIVSSSEGQKLAALGAAVFPGVKAAMREACMLIAKLDPSFSVVRDEVSAPV